MFKDVWADLEVSAARQSGEGIVKRLVGLDSICPMFLGVKMPGMLRTFILQVPKDSVPLPNAISESRGFHFTVQIRGDEIFSEYASLIISSSVERYNEVFASIADDLHGKIHALKKKQEVIASFLSRVRLWQVFFEKQADDGLSDEAQRGLYGELRFFNDHVLSIATNLEKAILTWTGPRSRQHDFQFGSISVEVKTSASKQHQKLQIASEQQLDETTLEKLYLYYLSVALIESGVDTLPALVDLIRCRLSPSGAAHSEFDNLLIEAGYLDMQRTRYEHVGYSTREFGIFVVEHDFPRIRECEIRPGVGDVKYSISVAQCSNYKISETELVASIKEAWS